MDTFNFPMHKVRHTYPQGDQQKFGGGYQYAVKPQLPLQRTFFLKFNAMKYGVTDSGFDMQQLIDFYEVHDLWDRFIYPHPTYGNLIVRFAKALEVPELLDNGFGATMPLEIQLIEQPL